MVHVIAGIGQPDPQGGAGVEGRRGVARQAGDMHSASVDEDQLARRRNRHLHQQVGQRGVVPVEAVLKAAGRAQVQTELAGADPFGPQRWIGPRAPLARHLVVQLIGIGRTICLGQAQFGRDRIVKADGHTQSRAEL